MTCRNPKWRTAALILMILTVLVLVSCGRQIEASETFTQRGLVYERGDDEPFTGVVIGKSRREGYRNFTCTFKKTYKDGKLEGRSYFYYDNGKIESIEPYEDGILNGVVTRYYDDGQLKARLHFVDGLRGGARGEMFWDEDGNRTRG